MYQLVFPLLHLADECIINQISKQITKSEKGQPVMLSVSEFNSLIGTVF